ncbi:methyltransferase domain-containing protein [Colletotrichum salicis]|uniref:Methyltransferase domain-containing protein n=1 Tax=Colletotrichum salicis TaxID=1209931 RepID=A0A135UNM4_9PEZI|nr:methyltransferase domain-containing protein [Colletotrichum salicis]
MRVYECREADEVDVDDEGDENDEIPKYNIDAWLTVPTPTVSLFGPQIVIAEKTAFAEFVQQVKAGHPDYDTILILQIGSEIGYLDWSRDVCDVALTTFDKGIPAEYLDFLVQSGSVLCAAETLAKIAKEAYLVPIIVNAALERAEGRKHGGPLPEILHLWKLFAPCIDLYAPRLLDNNYNEACETWGSDSDQPLLVQAHGQWDTASCQLWSAFDMSKRHESIIEHPTLLRQARPFFLDAQDQGHPHIGFTNAHDTTPWLLDRVSFHLTSGDFEITMKNSFYLAPWGIMYGLAISQGNGKLLLFGRNFEVKAKSRSDHVASTRILSFHEVEVDEQGRLQVQLTFNADETNGSRIARMSPEAPMIAELRFYYLQNPASYDGTRLFEDDSYLFSLVSEVDNNIIASTDIVMPEPVRTGEAQAVQPTADAPSASAPIEVDSAGSNDTSTMDDRNPGLMGPYTRSSYTTSLSSSAVNYPTEYGRTYHAFRAGSYNFPNDETIDNKLFLAPIDKAKTHRILDIGTGTGIWAIEMGDFFPKAEVLLSYNAPLNSLLTLTVPQITGIDLSPIQPSWVPPNVKFEVDDVESPWVGNKKYNFIFSRYMASSIADWQIYMTRIVENLTPGGWAEFQDWSLMLDSDDGSLNGTQTHRWATLFMEACANLGGDGAPGPKLNTWPEDHRFQNVEHRHYKIPIGPWAKDPSLKDIGMCNLIQMLEGLDAFTLKLFCTALDWTREEVLVLLSQVRQEMKACKSHVYLHFHVVYGQKPESED